MSAFHHFISLSKASHSIQISIMDPIAVSPEEWGRGDVIQHMKSGKIGKIFCEGDGETAYHRDDTGNLVYDHYGEEWLLLHFTEPSTKVKQGRKWKVVPGRKEEIWVELQNRDFVNLSQGVRSGPSSNTRGRSVGASLVADQCTPAISDAEQRTAESSVADQNTIVSTIATDSSTNFGHDDSNFDHDWIGADIEEDNSVNSETPNDTSLEATSSSPLRSEVGEKRGAPLQVRKDFKTHKKR